MDLDWLLNPTRCEDFLADSWERNPSHVEARGSSYYDALFPTQDLEAVLAAGKFTDDEVLVVKNGHQLGGYLRSDGTVDTAKLMAACPGEGKTLKLMNPELRHSRLASFCNEIEAELLCRATLCLFLTPPNSVGVDVHFDAVDVFVLQLSGEKVWRVYRPLFELPSKTEDRVAVLPEDVGDPLLDVVLGPGDLLYVPRGFPHEPFTRDSTSLHLSVGIHPIVWCDLLESALHRLRGRLKALRASVPASCLMTGTPDESMRQTLQELLSTLQEEIDLDESLSAVRADALSSLHRLSWEGQAGLVGSETLNGESWVRRRRGYKPEVQGRLEDKAALHFQGGSVAGPAAITEALKYIADHERFRVADLGPGLSERARLVLVKRLVREGFLIVDETIDVVETPERLAQQRSA